MERCHPGKRFELPADLHWMPPLPIDPDDLGEIVSNLLDNAGKWAGARVAVIVRQDAKGFSIAIDDDGSGVAPEDRQALFAIGRGCVKTRQGEGVGS